MSNEQEMREAFEKFFYDLYPMDMYVSTEDMMFKCWQAATLAAEARIRELEADAKAGRLFKDMALVAHQNGEKGFWVKLDADLTEHKENQG